MQQPLVHTAGRGKDRNSHAGSYVAPKWHIPFYLLFHCPWWVLWRPRLTSEGVVSLLKWAQEGRNTEGIRNSTNDSQTVFWVNRGFISKLHKTTQLTSNSSIWRKSPLSYASFKVSFFSAKWVITPNYLLFLKTGFIRKSYHQHFLQCLSNQCLHREKSKVVHAYVSLSLGHWEMERHDWLKVKFSPYLYISICNVNGLAPSNLVTLTLVTNLLAQFICFRWAFQSQATGIPSRSFLNLGSQPPC